MAETETRLPVTDKELRHILTSKNFDLIGALNDEEKQRLGRMKNRMLAKPGAVDPVKSQANVDRLQSETDPETSGPALGSQLAQFVAPAGGATREQLKQDVVANQILPGLGVALARRGQRKETFRKKAEQETYEEALENYRRRRIRPEGVDRQAIVSDRARFAGPGIRDQRADIREMLREAEAGKAKAIERKQAIARAVGFTVSALSGNQEETLRTVAAEFGKVWAQSTVETVVRPEQMSAEGRKLEVALNMLDIIPVAKSATTLARTGGVIGKLADASRAKKAAKAAEAAAVLKSTEDARLAKEAVEAAKKAELAAAKNAQRAAAEASQADRAGKAAAEAAKYKADLAAARATQQLKLAERAAENSARKTRNAEVDGVIEQVTEAAKVDTVAGSKGASGLQSAADSLRQSADDLARTGEPEVAAQARAQADRLESGANQVAEAAATKIDQEIETATAIPAVLEVSARTVKYTPEEQAKLNAAIEILSEKFGAATVKAGIESGAIRIVGIKSGRLLSDVEISNLKKIKDASAEPYSRTSGPANTHATHKIFKTKEEFLAHAKRVREAAKNKPPAPNLLRTISERSGKATEAQLAQQRKFNALGKGEKGSAARGAEKLVGKKAASEASSEASGIKQKLADLQRQYEKKSAKFAKGPMVPPSIQSDALRSITNKMDKLEKHLSEIEELGKAEAAIKLPPDAGEVNKKLVAVLAASPFGAAIGAQLAKETDENVYYGAVAGGLATVALGLIGSNPRRALDIFKRATQSNKDLGQVTMDFWEKILPDRLISPGQKAFAWSALSPTGFAAAGAVAGAIDKQDKPGGAALGALQGGVAGLVGGSVVGLVGARQALKAQNSFNPMRAMRKFLLDAPSSAPNLQGYALDPIHQATRERLVRDGYASGYRFKQGQKAYDKANEAEKAVWKDYLANKASIDALPEHLQEPAALYKHSWQELTSALAEVDMTYAQGVSELGKFDQRLYAVLRNNDDYERVARFLADGVPGSRRLTPEVFETLKRRRLPPDVQRSLDQMAKDFDLDNPNLVSNFEDLSHQMETRKFAMVAAAYPDLSRGLREVEDGLKSGDILRHKENAQGLMEAETKAQRFIQLPDSPKYGALAGRYVDSFLAEDMMDLVTTPRRIHDALQPVLSTFKRAKVTWNPATHVRNIIGAFSMTNGTAGVPMRSMVWVDGAKDFRDGSALFKEARDIGVFGRTFVKSDLTKDLVDKLVTHLAGKGGAMDNYLNFSRDVGTAVNKGLHKAEDIFEMEEEINKMILYRHARTAKNMSPDDAAKFALKYGYDYDSVSGWVRWSKSSIFGSPFITFAYKAMPRAFEAATDIRDPKRMLSFWKYPMVMAAVNEISASKLGLLDEQNLDTSAFGRFKRVALNGLGLGIGKGGMYEDSIHQRFMPDYWGSNQVLMPYRDQDGVMRTFDATYYIGWGDIGELGKGPIGQNLAKHGIQGFPRAFEPGHPVLSSFVAVLSGRDMQSGREIDNPLSYIGGTFAPSWLPWLGRGAQRIERSFGNAPGKEGPGQAVAGALGGVSVRNFDPHTEWSKTVKAAKSREANAAKALNSLGRKDATEAELGRAQTEKNEAKKERKELEKQEPPKNRILNRANAKFSREQKRKRNAAARALRKVR